MAQAEAAVRVSNIIGSMPTFEPSQLSFEEWSEILMAWLTANDIDNDNKKHAILLTSVGTKGYHMLRSLLQPNKPSEKSFTECIDVLKDHYMPKPSEIVLRYRFYTRSQKQGETIPRFVADLKRLSDGCNFQELNNMLRDRIVVGCREPNIQRKLLSVKDLTFEKAMTEATAMEMANKDVADLNRHGSDTNVNKISGVRKKAERHGKPFTGTKKQTSYAGDSNSICWRCGGKHYPANCRFKTEKCHKCRWKGHTQSQCDSVQEYRRTHASKRQNENRTHNLEYGPEADLMHLQQVNRLQNDPFYVDISVNGYNVTFELDSGSPRTLVSENTLKNIGAQIKPTGTNLKTYNGALVNIIGESEVEVQQSGRKTQTLTLLVVKQGADLCGRDWIRQLPVSMVDACSSFDAEIELSAPVCALSTEIGQHLDKILEAQAEIFDNSVHGKLQGHQAKVYPVSDEMPRFYKAASVSYADRDKVDKTLDDLLKQGIIEPVQFSEYACPLVVAKKPDGNVRICGNYKLTANKVLKLEQYPIPTLDELLQSLQGGERYTKLDLSHAYHQIELEPSARKYTTVNTHRGLFQFCRLPFGIASAPAIFQRTIESLVGDIPMCRAYLDDIIISGRNDQEHLANVCSVLQRLRECGIKLRKDKCEFMKDSVTYLGHQLDLNGIRPIEDKVQAIRDAPVPKNQGELQAYLGLLGYYRKFIPNLSKHVAPLYELLKDEYCSKRPGAERRKRRSKVKPVKPDPKFVWGPEQDKAFAVSKKLLESNTLLVHYDPSKPLLLQVDASPYGLGAVISHQMPDGSDQPIAFASRTLSTSEKNYAQYEKEGLSIIFGLKKFHKFLHGRHFTIVTDHMPLIHLFGNNKPASPMASARVTRWHMILSAYEYDIVHKSGKDHLNADALSRLPLEDNEQMNLLYDESDKLYINMLADLDTCPVTAQEVKQLTDKDPVLSRVRSYLLQGWPDKSQLDDNFRPYSQKREEMSVSDGIVLWGQRVIIPNNVELRKRLLGELHVTHPGIVKMKALSRSYIWWPRIDQEVEHVVNCCLECQEHQSNPSKVPIHPWEFPQNPWERIHIDYANIEGNDVLICIDVHSKWIEAIVMPSTTSKATIRVLRQLFARHGIADTVVSDNGPQFVAEEFYDFLSKNGVEFIQTPPKHPSSNGMAERAVQTVKSGVKKIVGSDLDERIQKFLMTYRVTPQATTGTTPSELLLRRKIKTRLDLLRPDLKKKITHKQANMKAYKSGKTRSLQILDSVMAKNFSSGPTWLHGVVTEIVSDTIYEIKLNDSRTVRRHVDQIRSCPDYQPQIDIRNSSAESDILPVEIPNSIEPVSSVNVPKQVLRDSSPVRMESSIPELPKSVSESSEPPKSDPPSEIRTSSRLRQAPVKLKDYVVK